MKTFATGLTADLVAADPVHKSDYETGLKTFLGFARRPRGQGGQHEGPICRHAR